MILWLAACKPAVPTVVVPTATDVPTVVPATPTPAPPTPDPPTVPAPTGHTGSTADTGSPGTGDTGPFVVGCDSGDTGSLGIPDCNGACYPEAFVGDGLICDDGTVRPWGSPDFDCAAFGYDGGDCPSDTGSP